MFDQWSSTSCRGCCRAVATPQDPVIRAHSPCRYDRPLKKKKKPNVQSKILECIICPNIRNRLMCIYMLNRKKKEKKEKFNRVSSGAASSGAGSPTTASSPEAAGCSRKRRPSWSKFNPTKITSASWHTSSCETTTSKAGTVAGRDHGPRGVRTVR